MDVITVPQTSRHEQRMRRRREVKAMRSRERIKTFIRALVCCGILAALLALGIFAGWVPLPGPTIDASRVSSAGLPADPFVETRTGRILISVRNGIFCREVLFNNESGQRSSDKTVRCDEPEPDNSNPKSRMSRELVDALSGGFKKQ